MRMEFTVEINKKIYEISELVKDVSYTDKLNDGCSKLEFSYIDDNLEIENGCIVRFKYDDTGIFYGVVFKHGQNSKGEITVTAYDQLRYCKAKDSFSYSGYTISTLISKMCNHYGLISGKLADTGYVLKTKVVNNESWLDIIYSAISETLQNTGRFYILRDEFGKVALRNLEELEIKNAVLGDYSFAYDYNYEKSIDDNFYNLIRIQDKKNKQFIEAKDKTSINKYGLLQYFDVANEKMNASQIKSMAATLLSLYNQEAESLTLECLGDVSVRAGSSFYVLIDSIGLNKRLYVKSVTHKFMPVHTMSVEVRM